MRGFWGALAFLVELFVGDSLEFEASCAEVDEQANFQVVCLQVVDGLGQVNVFQLNNRLQFHTDYIVYQKIYPSRPDVLAF